MDAKFTKGPWVVFGDWGIQAKGEASCLATFEYTRLDDGTSNGFDNAHLIAAAPDMYDVLIELRSSLLAMVNCGIVGELNHEYVIDKMKAIDAVLANARGEQ